MAQRSADLAHDSCTLRRPVRHFESAHLWTLVACGLVIMARAWPRLMRAHFWAEDGNLFFPQAVAQGYRSFFEPYADYYHLAPRLFAYAFTFFPLLYYPTLICLSSMLVFVATAALFSKGSYAWLVPSQALRTLLCLAICMAPGLREIIGNLANLHTVLIVYLCLICLRDSRSGITPVELAICFLGVGSEGACFVLLPSLVWRLSAYKISTKEAWWSDLVLCFLIIAFFVVNLLEAHRSTPASFNDLTHMLFSRDFEIGIARLIAERYVILPLFGPHVAALAQRSTWIYVAALPALAAAYRRIARNYSRHQLITLLFGAGALSLVSVVTWLVRPGSLGLFMEGGQRVLGTRYAFGTAPFALILWVIVAQHIAPKRCGAAVALFFLAFNICIFPDPLFLGHAHGDRDDWAASVQRIEESRRSGSKPEVVFPCNPPGWNGYYPAGS